MGKQWKTISIETILFPLITHPALPLMNAPHLTTRFVHILYQSSLITYSVHWDAISFLERNNFMHTKKIIRPNRESRCFIITRYMIGLDQLLCFRLPSCEITLIFHKIKVNEILRKFPKFALIFLRVNFL